MCGFIRFRVHGKLALKRVQIRLERSGLNDVLHELTHSIINDLGVSWAAHGICYRALKRALEQHLQADFWDHAAALHETTEWKSDEVKDDLECHSHERRTL